MKQLDIINLNLEPLLGVINKLLDASDKRPLIIAIDGKSCTGKSTIADHLANLLRATRVDYDNFFIGGDNNYWRSKDIHYRYDRATDWDRASDSLLAPLTNGRTAIWFPFNWQKGSGLAPNAITTKPKDIIIIEGTFITRPELSHYFCYKILCTLPEKTRQERIFKRMAGQTYDHDYAKIWEPVWDYYYLKISPPKSFDLVVTSITK